MYLGLITDKWSRKIVGFHLGETLETSSVLKALAMALRGLKQRERPIHHSDRGCQYASHAYVNVAQQAGLTMSMTEKNHSAENALAEFRIKRAGPQGNREGIHLYNYRRPHTALRFNTPGMVHDNQNAN